MPGIRAAAEADLDAIVALADGSRQRYAAYEPVFWRPADDAVARHRAFLAGLLADDDATVLVSVASAEVSGFVVALLVPAPPVYRPGGAVCLIDDFVVSPAGDWRSAGVALLRAAAAAAAERGAVQVVVVAGHEDGPKREALAAAGLHVGSEWWMTGLPLQA
jgi:GNAT superfamily N-acetyltransferase